MFNSLGWTRQENIIIPVNRPDLTVLDASGNKILSQVSPTMGHVRSTYELFFSAQVGPLGFTTYFVQAPTGEPKTTHVTTISQIEFPAPQDTVLENSILRVTISSTTGRISNIANKKSGVSLNVDQNLQAYVSSSSGAYAFKPAGPSSPLSTQPPRTVKTEGQVVTEVQQQFTTYGKQTIRLFNSNQKEDAEGYLEIDFDLGPLPSHREVVTTFSTPLNTKRTITTDDNGFELLTRQYNPSLGIEANYYPLVYSAFINEGSSQLNVISERSHGAASANNGELEVMVHRNPDSGDGFGPSMTDTSEVYPSLRVNVDSPSASWSHLHHQPYLMNFPLTIFADVANSASDWSSTYMTQKNLLNGDLPPNVHLLSLNALNATSKGVILRLTHLYGVGEDPALSKPVSVDLANIFSGVKVTSVRETTLTANKGLSTSLVAPVELSPKDIRTFVIEFGL